jgi:hypothetical protein
MPFLHFLGVDDKMIANIMKYKHKSNTFSFFKDKSTPPHTKLLTFLKGQQHEFSLTITVDF